MLKHVVHNSYYYSLKGAGAAQSLKQLIYEVKEGGTEVRFQAGINRLV
jgi:hypothetical protein